MTKVFRIRAQLWIKISVSMGSHLRLLNEIYMKFPELTHFETLFYDKRLEDFSKY